MTEAYFDVLAIGNAIVDVQAAAAEELLAREKLVKGTMRLIDDLEADRLYALMGPARETSGGSAANTVAGLAALGGRAAFAGKVASDNLGRIFAHDIRAAGVQYETPATNAPPATARCLILITPDAQRTMNTFLGASQCLAVDDLDRAAIERSRVLYLEGYLWDPPLPRAAMRQAIGWAKAAGGRVAFTLSDTFCVERHRADFQELLDGAIDILFANEHEAMALTGTYSFEAAADALKDRAPVVVITRSEKGATGFSGGHAVHVPAAKVAAVVDTTGAGDLFAAGFLAAFTRDRGLEDSLKLGAVAAAEVISHYGARPQADLRALAGGLI